MGFTLSQVFDILLTKQLIVNSKKNFQKMKCSWNWSWIAAPCKRTTYRGIYWLLVGLKMVYSVKYMKSVNELNNRTREQAKKDLLCIVELVSALRCGEKMYVSHPVDQEFLFLPSCNANYGSAKGSLMFNLEDVEVSTDHFASWLHWFAICLNLKNAKLTLPQLIPLKPWDEIGNSEDTLWVLQ